MAKRRRVSKIRASALKHGYRSGLEESLDTTLKQKGIDGQYEQHKIEYVKPATQHTYTPDFKLPNGIYIETKGRFVLADRKKHSPPNKMVEAQGIEPWSERVPCRL